MTDPWDAEDERKHQRVERPYTPPPREELFGPRKAVAMALRATLPLLVLAAVAVVIALIF